MAVLKAVVLAGPDPAVDNRAMAHRRSLPVGGGALGRQLQRDRDVDCCGRSTCRIAKPDRGIRRQRKGRTTVRKGALLPPEGNRAGSSGSQAV
jgi:hypothetical protein